METARGKAGKGAAQDSPGWLRSPSTDKALIGFIEAMPPEKMDVVVAAVARSSEGRAAVLKAASALAGVELVPAEAAPAQEPSAEDLDTESLVRAAGGLLTVTEAADRLRQTRQSINEMLKAGRILGVRFGNRWHLPAIQFRHHQVQPGLAAVLQGMGDLDPWRKLQVLLAPSEPDERRPIELLRRGETGQALTTAARAVAAARVASGAPLRTTIHPSLDADLEADLRRDREIDATEPYTPEG